MLAAGEVEPKIWISVVTQPLNFPFFINRLLLHWKKEELRVCCFSQETLDQQTERWLVMIVNKSFKSHVP